MAGTTTTVNNIDLSEIKFVKQLAGKEDMMFGFGVISQIRNGQHTELSLINAETIPYDGTDNVKTIIAKILAKYPI